jgi:rRNA maturation protein Nop10
MAKMRVESEHIQLTLECPECGHQFDIDDYDSNCIQEAKRMAANEACPECGESA